MPTYTATGTYTPRIGTVSRYRLDIAARTSEAPGGTLVEIFAAVTMTSNPGVPAFGSNGSRSWSLPGGRLNSTSGTADQSGSSTFSYNFSNTNPLTVYNYFDRYVAFGAGNLNSGNTSRLTVTVSTPTSDFFTSRTLTIDVPLFQAPAATTYTLSYNSNGGSSTPSSQSLTAGATFTAAAAPTRSGFNFVHWSGSNGLTYAAGATGTMPAGALTLTAVWSGGEVSGLTVGTITQTSIRVSWTAISGVTTYNLYLNEDFIATSSSSSYTFQNLQPGTLYSLGVAVPSAGGVGTISRVSATTTAPDPAYPAGAEYATAKIGLPYSSSVTATNGVSYELAYGSLPPGLSLATNGTISGTPEQRPDGSFFNETAGTLDSFTFGIKAVGVSGSTAQIQQFTINTVFPASRFATVSSPRSFIIAKRWDGTQWVPIQKARKFNGTSWVDLSN